MGWQLALGDGVEINPQRAELLLGLSANVDKNVDAYLLAAQLLQKGDVFEKSLPNAYLALLKAQALGADVTDKLKHLEPLLTEKERENAKWWADFEPSLVTLEPIGPQISQPSCSYSSR